MAQTTSGLAKVITWKDAGNGQDASSAPVS